MSTVVSDNILMALYLLVWLLTFVWYHWRHHELDAGSAIIGSYVAYAAISIISLNDDLFNWMYKPLALFPFIYLYLMLMLALSPVIHLHFHPAKEIEDPHTRMIVPFCWFIFVCSLCILPNIIANFSDGFVKLFTDVDAGHDAYMEQLDESGDAGSTITNIPAIIFNACYDAAVFFAFYFLSRKEKNWPLILALLFTTFVGAMLPIMRGQRGGVILAMLTIIAAYFFFKHFLSKGIRRAVRLFGIVAVIAMVLPVAAITISRFGETNAGITGYISWYVGQENIYFNNSAMDAGGIRYGDRTINLVKRAIDPSTPKNFVERRIKYRNLEIDDYYFVTFVGDFCLDFGPILAVIIFLIFNLLVLHQIYPKEGDDEDCISLHNLLLIYFVVCICMQGGMYLFAYSDLGGNLRIIVFAGLYAYLRLHKRLLEKFPLSLHQPISSEQ